MAAALSYPTNRNIFDEIKTALIDKCEDFIKYELLDQLTNKGFFVPEASYKSWRTKVETTIDRLSEAKNYKDIRDAMDLIPLPLWRLKLTLSEELIAKKLTLQTHKSSQF